MTQSNTEEQAFPGVERFTKAWWQLYGDQPGPLLEAQDLASQFGASFDAMVSEGLIVVEEGQVRLAEVPEGRDGPEESE